MSPKRRNSRRASQKFYTPSISPMKMDFSKIEKRFKERKIHRLQKKKKLKQRRLRSKSKTKPSNSGRLTSNGRGIRKRNSNANVIKNSSRSKTKSRKSKVYTANYIPNSRLYPGGSQTRSSKASQSNRSSKKSKNQPLPTKKSNFSKGKINEELD